MNTLLPSLHDTDAILLMYLANELSADDRRAIDARLTQEAPLQEKLAALTALYGAADASIAAADAGTFLPSSFAAARAFGEAARQRQRRQPIPDEIIVIQRRQLKWLAYPAVAVALLAFGMALWTRSALNEVTGNGNRVKTQANTESVTPNPSLSGWASSGLHGRMLTPPPSIGRDIGQLQDPEIEQLFNPLVTDQTEPFDQQLSLLQTMDAALE